MQLVLGQTYRFEFDTPFEALGYVLETNPTGGYYTVTEQLTYERLCERGVDLLELLYTPAGLAQTDLDAAVTAGTFIGATFVHLKSVVDNSSIYAPTASIVGVPIIDIHQYAKVCLNIDLGVFADEALLDEITALVSGLLLWKYGIGASSGDVRLLTYDRQWMTAVEYAAIDDARIAAKAAEAASVPSDLSALGITDQNQHLWAALKLMSDRAVRAEAAKAALEATVRQLSA